MNHCPKNSRIQRSKPQKIKSLDIVTVKEIKDAFDKDEFAHPNTSLAAKELLARAPNKNKRKGTIWRIYSQEEDTIHDHQ